LGTRPSLDAVTGNVGVVACDTSLDTTDDLLHDGTCRTQYSYIVIRHTFHSKLRVSLSATAHIGSSNLSARATQCGLLLYYNMERLSARQAVTVSQWPSVSGSVV
jgi:hypothetical protein